HDIPFNTIKTDQNALVARMNARQERLCLLFLYRLKQPLSARRAGRADPRLASGADGDPGELAFTYLDHIGASLQLQILVFHTLGIDPHPTLLYIAPGLGAGAGQTGFFKDSQNTKRARAEVDFGHFLRNGAVTETRLEIGQR